MKIQDTEARNTALAGESPEGSLRLPQSLRASEISRDQEVSHPSFMRRLWNGWLKIAEIIGTFQMMVVLTLLYWTMITIMAIPFRFLSDPLVLKRSSRPGWIQRAPPKDVLESMRRQF